MNIDWFGVILFGLWILIGGLGLAVAIAKLFTKDKP